MTRKKKILEQMPQQSVQLKIIRKCFETEKDFEEFAKRYIENRGQHTVNFDEEDIRLFKEGKMIAAEWATYWGLKLGEAVVRKLGKLYLYALKYEYALEGKILHKGEFIKRKTKS